MLGFLKKNGAALTALSAAAAVFLVLMMFTGQWPWRANDYNTYALQADAWLHGRLMVSSQRAWTSRRGSFFRKYSANARPAKSRMAAPVIFFPFMFSP